MRRTRFQPNVVPPCRPLNSPATTLSIVAAAAPATEDARFEAFAQKYIQEQLDRDPETATRLGEHRNDARLNDYSAQGVQHELNAAKGGLKELAGIDAKKLSPENAVDSRILKNRLDEASKLDNEILKANAHDVEALVYKAQVQIGKNDPSGAIDSLQSALHDDQDNAVALGQGDQRAQIARHTHLMNDENGACARRNCFSQGPGGFVFSALATFARRLSATDHE